jgi:hypothetical protein
MDSKAQRKINFLISYSSMTSKNSYFLAAEGLEETTLPRQIAHTSAATSSSY